MKNFTVCALIAFSFSSFANEGKGQRVKNLSKEVNELVSNHIQKLDNRDKRYVRLQLRKIKATFKKYDFEAPVKYKAKYFSAKCKISGYSSQATVGPFKTLEGLKEACKKTFSSRYSDLTYVTELNTHEYEISKDTYFTGECRINGYTSKRIVGPVKSIEALHKECKASFSSEYRDSTYLKNVTKTEYPTGENIYYQATCKINGYLNQGITNPEKSVDLLLEACKESWDEEYKGLAYLKDIISFGL